jgi:hypothetical protein
LHLDSSLEFHSPAMFMCTADLRKPVINVRRVKVDIRAFDGDSAEDALGVFSDTVPEVSTCYPDSTDRDGREEFEDR